MTKNSNRDFFQFIGAVLVCCLPTPALLAQDAEIIQITGSRVPAVQTTTFRLSRDDIDSINPETTIDLIRSLPGVTVFQNASNDRLSYISIRGGESNFTLIMINNVRVNDPTNSRGGGVDFTQLEPNLISSIELYPGNISAVYGSSAMNGVIHIRTRQKDYSGISLEAGTDSSTRINLSASARTALGDGILSISKVQDRNSPVHDLTSKQFLAGLSGSLEKIPYAFQVNYSDNQSSAFPEDSGGYHLAVNRQLESIDSNQLIAGGSFVVPVQEHLTINTRFSWLRHEENITSPAIYPGILDGIPASKTDSLFKEKEIDGYITWELDNNSIIAGATLNDADGTNNSVLDFGFPFVTEFTRNQHQNSLYTEFQTTLDRWLFRAGIRKDNPSQYENNTSTRISGEFTLNRNWHVQAELGEGYKLPSFFALSHPLIGNPGLRPEVSLSRSLSMLYSEGGNIKNFTFTLFSNRYRDLVDFDPDSFLLVNRNSIKSKGVELSGSAKLTEYLEMIADASFMDFESDEPGIHLRRRPKKEYSLALKLNTGGNFTGHARVGKTGAFFDSSIPTGQLLMPSFFLADISGTWAIWESLNMTLSINNIFDNNYQQSVGFDEKGLNARLKIDYLIH